MEKKILIGAGVIVLLVAASIFLRQEGKASPAQETRTIRVSGAWALYPLMVKWADEYQKLNPGVRIEVSAGGAGKGMADALNNLVEIGMVSRDIDPSETQKGAHGIRVAKDAVVATANKGNPSAEELKIHGLKRNQLIEAFTSGKDVTWASLTGRQDSVKKVSVYVRSDSCGAGEIWGKFLGVKQEDLIGVGVNGDPGIAEAVSRDVYGMGFNNLNFAYDPKTGKPVGSLMIVPVDFNENGAIDAAENFYESKGDMVAAIADGRYPMPPARDLYIVTKGKPTGATRDFISWILQDGQKHVIDQGYIPLKGDILADELKSLG
jgi:phosphate transport system substrate-binding protein